MNGWEMGNRGAFKEDQPNRVSVLWGNDAEVPEDTEETV